MRLTLPDLTGCGAHQKGHFLLSSGLHSSDYLQMALYLAQPRRSQQAGHLMANAISSAVVKPDLVAAPALGGIVIGHETARALNVPFIFSERANGAMALRRGFTVQANQGVVVVEDVITTGRSSRELIALIEQLGGYAIGVASLVNRSGAENPFEPLPYRALLSVEFPMWGAAACPLCRQGRKVDRPGSRPIK